MNILVTGGSGYLGGFTIVSLLEAKNDGRLDPSLHIHTSSRASVSVEDVLDPADAECVTFREINLTNENQVNAWVEAVRPAVVIHTAALSSVGACEKDRPLAMANNCPYMLIEAVQRHCSKNVLFLFTSTDLVYDGEHPPYKASPVRHTPSTAYGQTKVAFEMEVLRLRYGFCFRLSNMLGPSHGMLPTKGQKFLQWVVDCCDKRLSVGLRVDEMRSFVYVSDVVSIFLQCICDHFCPTPVPGSPKSPSSKRGCIFNIGGPVGHSRLDVAREVAKRKQISLVVHNDEATALAAGKAAASRAPHEWHVFKQSNAESAAASGIRNPRDVTMDSGSTELVFGIRFADLRSIVERVVPGGED